MQSQNDGGRGPLLFAHKSRGLGHRQMHPRRFNLTQRTDAAGQLAFKAAQIIDALYKLAGAKLLVFKQFKTHIASLGQALTGQLQAGFINQSLRHRDSGAALGKLVGHIHLLQCSNDGGTIAFVDVCKQHSVVLVAFSC